VISSGLRLLNHRTLHRSTRTGPSPSRWRSATRGRFLLDNSGRHPFGNSARESTKGPRGGLAEVAMDTMADRLNARGRRDRALISGCRQPPDELPRPSVVSLQYGGETCLAAAPLTFQRTTSKLRLRRARTLDGLGKSHFHGWPKLPPRSPWGWSDDISAGDFSNWMTDFSPISACRGSGPSKKRSSPPGPIH
jgi:hypothetical protein